ncbi:MAG: hypothetical protein SOT34_03625, partial [Candidatus Borkfalkiaceae bacterium]|nr:hypothetical protein [Christensenellaceae bacterium]
MTKQKTFAVLLVTLLIGCFCSVLPAVHGTFVARAGDAGTATAKTVKEERLTDLSCWTDVASTAMANEFSRELDTVIHVSFRMMWDETALYVLVETDDASVDTWDQIEFAYTNGSANGYFKASMLPDNGTRWTESIGDLMTSVALADFSADGKRYLLTRHVLSDKTALGTGKTVVVNAVYWDFNGSHASV